MAGERQARRTRTPISDSGRSKLSVRGKSPDYEYRIVNDVPGRVEMFKEAGWVPEEDSSVQIGDRRIGTPTQEGSVKTVSVGGGLTGVLMKIKREFWEEDVAAKEARSKAQYEGTLDQSRRSGDYGSIKTDK